MSHTCSSAHHLPQLPQPLILWLLFSGQSTFTLDARHPFSRCLPTPYHEVWLSSFFEEKRGIQRLDTYRKITLGKYCALCKKGAPKAIPMMCVLTVKCNENFILLWAKSWIVVLSNHEDLVWSKSDCFAPVLCSNSLRFLVSMAVEKHCPLCQGDCKNAFCQGILPPEEVTIVRSPSGDPKAEPNEYWLLLRMLYGLRRSP
jgi:hypothetical protein